MKDRKLRDHPLVTRLIEQNDARHFYCTLLGKLFETELLSSDMSVLVICGTTKDKSVLSKVGFTDVTISNLDTRSPHDEFYPYTWSYQDAENLDFPAERFDFVVVNAGLHHCQSPHRALLEMYRVARKGILVIEARESLLMKIALRMGLAEEYEICNVVSEGLEFGGVRNTRVPNYVYRWTEREIQKTIASYAPHAKHDVQFYYDVKFPFSSLVDRRPILLVAGIALYPFVKLAGKLFQKQSNLFAFFIRKPTLPQQLLPWLKLEGNEVALNMAWIENRYAVTKDGDNR